MPTIKIIDSIKIDIYSREHLPPHFHALFAIGQIEKHPYEIGPDVLFQFSEPIDSQTLKPGFIIKTARLKAGLTQEQLATRSGTTRFYISRLENNKTDVEISTFRKIIEAGLGKQLKLIIE